MIAFKLDPKSGVPFYRQIIDQIRYGIAAGQVLRENMLRAPYSVKQGQSVQLSVQGQGFSISSSGVALNNAAKGEPVQIRTSTGRVISGVAGTEGIVIISP